MPPVLHVEQLTKSVEIHLLSGGRDVKYDDG